MDRIDFHLELMRQNCVQSRVMLEHLMEVLDDTSPDMKRFNHLLRQYVDHQQKWLSRWSDCVTEISALYQDWVSMGQRLDALKLEKPTYEGVYKKAYEDGYSDGFRHGCLPFSPDDGTTGSLEPLH